MALMWCMIPLVWLKQGNLKEDGFVDRILMKCWWNVALNVLHGMAVSSSLALLKVPSKRSLLTVCCWRISLQCKYLLIRYNIRTCIHDCLSIVAYIGAHIPKMNLSVSLKSGIRCLNYSSLVNCNLPCMKRSILWTPFLKAWWLSMIVNLTPRSLPRLAMMRASFKWHVF